MTRLPTRLIVGLLAASFAWIGCPTTITGPASEADGGIASDGGTSSGQDSGTSSGSDGGSSGLDSTVYPDATAEEGGYLISSADGQPGTEGTGSMPAGDPSSAVYIDPFSGNTTFIPGGTNMFSGDIQGGLIQALVVGFEELGGYWEVSSDYTSFSIFATLGQDVRRANLTLVLVPVLAVTESQPMGGYGRPLRVPCTVQQVGTGDLQVSLSWGTATDVDLHLVEPSGEEIYYGHLNAASGGNLDLDSNPACDFDNVNNENITYQNTTPPGGHYIVRVDYWSACSEAGTTDFVVTVNIRGEANVYQGSLTPSDETGGSAGDGITVAEFDF